MGLESAAMRRVRCVDDAVRIASVEVAAGRAGPKDRENYTALKPRHYKGAKKNRRTRRRWFQIDGIPNRYIPGSSLWQGNAEAIFTRRAASSSRIRRARSSATPLCFSTT